MIVLGIDPGASVTACTLIRARFDAVLGLSYYRSDEVPNEDLVGYLLDLPVHVVGIERPRGIAYGSKGAGIVPHLMDAAHAAGVAEGIVEARRRRGDNVLAWRSFPATEWRHRIVGKPSATDAEIANVIPRRVVDWPSRSNNHERDAAGAAVYAAQTAGLQIFQREREAIEAKRLANRGGAHG